MPRMDQTIKQKWISKLKADSMIKVKGALQESLESPNMVCVYGALCQVAVEEGVIPPPVEDPYGVSFAGRIYCPPGRVLTWAGLAWFSSVISPNGEGPAELNDESSLTLSQIADLINYYL